MRLKSLEVVGFKSFSEQTLITFAPGITAVVGPNGCGKSNVVDAIRWVLGEQAPTRLRGKSTEDLIYAGNEANAPAGMAEVTLVLEAEEGATLPEPYTMLHEVGVTRRVYRSGDSEYLINRIQCRLKDITEFFMASQIHSRSFAIIEQGRVEEIIQSKPHELRGMIEECAGLSLFKGRRELSERKLERVKENLARVDDVLSEIERQLNYARRQAKKAEAYRLIKAELTELERYHGARRIFDQRIELAAESERSEELRARGESLRAAVSELQSATESAANLAQASASELASARRELENVRAGANQRARTREFLGRRLANIDESEPQQAALVSQLAEKATLARAARAAAGAAFARERNSGDGGEAELEEVRGVHGAAAAALKKVERRGEDLKDDLSEVVREAAVIRGRLGDLAGERADLGERIGRGAVECPALAEAAANAQAAMLAANEALSAARAELESTEASHRDATEREIQARSSVEQLGARIKALGEAIEAARAQAEAAAVARRSDRRLRTVLESLNGDRPPVDPEVLANVMRAPAELQPALSAVLGDAMEAVIVESPHFALRAIEILKQKDSGRLSFIPQPDDGGAVAHETIEAPGIAGRLVDMIGIDPKYRTVVEMMLGHVIVADDLNCAMAASNLNGHGTLFVTRDGDMVAPGRMISGGSLDPAHRAGAKAVPVHPLEETAAQLSRAQSEYEVMRQTLAERTSARAGCAAMLGDSRQRAGDAERAALAARAEAASTEQKARLAQAQLEGARRRLAEINDQFSAANARLETLALTEQTSRAQLVALRDEIAIRRGALEELGAAMLEMAAHVEARRAQLTAMEREFRHSIQLAADLERQIEEGEARLVRVREERAEFRAELEKLAALDNEAREREAELEQAIVRLDAECAERSAELEKRRASLRQVRGELEAAESEAVECGLKCERARTLVAELERSFSEKFAVEFDSAAEELAAAIAPRDPAADDARIAELRAKAEKIGEVNLAAESEVKELEERASTLRTERADLDTAVKDLTATITRLNREARKRFAETFEGAARNFEEIFPKLLPGGKGRLELEQADDVLEAGVNILVQPAGKKVKEVALLSGGEKALSAMALIFSLFLLNPSPFCVMDEVDAPLDEFRLQAFTGLVAELKERSQFIIITHNQRTMQKADHIHGVTMDRPGISRVISLKIPQAA